MAAQLDHVVLLLPFRDIVNPPDWITRNFTLSPGGRHGDGKTENRLILFSDRTYLELIAFIDDDADRRVGHWWDLDFGVVDFALTTTDAVDWPDVNNRLRKSSTDISYAEPREGARLTSNGEQLRWKVTFPRGARRGAVPFWCHDLTPRERRVPITKENATHPCGAVGMAGVRIDTDAASVSRLAAATAAILRLDLDRENQHHIVAPWEIPDGKRPSIKIENTRPGESSYLSLSLVLQTPQEVPAIRHKIGDGLVSITFETPG